MRAVAGRGGEWVVGGLLAVAAAAGGAGARSVRAGEAAEPVLRTVEQGESRVVLDLAPQVLRLELREDTLEETVGWGQRPGPARTVQPDILPVLPAASVQRFVPAAVLAQKAKSFDDGLYAAVEIAAQGGPAGKAELLRRLRERLAAARVDGAGAEVVEAAAVLGAVPGSPPPHLGAAVRTRIAAFDADEKRSKPLGFYTWTDDLRRVFRQDRMLQSEIDAADAVAVGAALRADEATWAAYGRILTLYERLTNPWESLDFRAPLVVPEPGAPPRPYRLLPPSRSYEGDLVKRHWGNRSIPEGASAFQLLIDEVKAGRLSLEPGTRSGWYDRVAWALEPLLRPESVPEAAKLDLGVRYRAYLEELFKGLLALVRETHVKQVEMPPAGAAAPLPAVEVSPGLTLEPLATHYARRAEAYGFVRGALEEHFGKEGLLALRRLTADGPVRASLGQELAAMEALFRGAAATVRAEIGASGVAGDSAPDRERFAAFRAGAMTDPDLARDARMMVPVFYDVERRQTKVWAFLGWTEQWLDVSFATPPRVVSRTSTRGPGAGVPEVEFHGQSVQVFSPVVAEVYVGRLLDREEFRRLCDRWKTRSAILAHLE